MSPSGSFQRLAKLSFCLHDVMGSRLASEVYCFNELRFFFVQILNSDKICTGKLLKATFASPQRGFCRYVNSKLCRDDAEKSQSQCLFSACFPVIMAVLLVDRVLRLKRV